MLALSAFVPAGLAASRVLNVADASHDLGTARVLGLQPQPWRLLDVAVGALFAAVPVGTLAARAAMGGALLLGATGVCFYVIARQLVAACAAASWFGPPVAAIVALAAVLAPAWQLEGATVGGAATGGLLTVLPLALIVGLVSTTPRRSRGRAVARDLERRGCWKAAAFFVGLAFSQEPLAGVCAACACAPFAVDERIRPGESWRVLGGWMVAGVAPQLVCVARLGAAGAPFGQAYAYAWAQDGGGSAAVRPLLDSIGSEIGWATTFLALLGLALGLRIAQSRRIVLALMGLGAAGMLSVLFGAPTGPVRFGPAWLATVGAVSVLAGPSVQAILRLVASGGGTAARSTAALLLLVALVLSVESAAQTLERSRGRSSDAVAFWDDVIWGSLPARSLLLVDDDVVSDRAFGARAAGSIRGDVTILPVGRRGPPPAARGDAARDPSLLPLIRDFQLLGKPSEGTFSTVAAERPLFMAYQPSWGRPLARHLVPLTLFDRFAPEPRTSGDRRRAVDAFGERSDRLVQVASDDPQLAEVTRRLLRAREELLKEAGGR